MVETSVWRSGATTQWHLIQLVARLCQGEILIGKVAYVNQFNIPFAFSASSAMTANLYSYCDLLNKPCPQMNVI